MRDAARDRGRDRDRGQSELLGFVLVFGVVILSIVLLGATGFVGLDNARDFQRTTNAEQAFTALADDVDEVASRGAPSRTTEVRVDDASLAVAEPTTIRVEVTDTANGTTLVDRTVETRPIVYDSGSGTRIAYASGALIRQDGENGLVFREPRVVLTGETVILPLVATSPAGTERVGGTSAVAVGTRRTGSDVIAASDDAADLSVTLELTSPRVGAWEAYLDGETAATCTDAVAGDDTVTCSIDPSARLSVSVTHVEVELV